MRRLDFASCMFLLFQQKLPTPQQGRLLNAMLVSVIDHSIVATSAVTRIVSASGVPIQACVAAGIMTVGDIHGGAGADLSRRLEGWVQEARAAGQSIDDKAREVAAGLRERGERLDGLGHPLHPKGDVRVDTLVAMARELGLEGPHLGLALGLSRLLGEAAGRALPLNIDGVIAALASDLGFDWRLGRALIFVPRSAGLAAHAVEEAQRERGWRKVADPDDIDYDGPSSRAFDG
jgi:citrate synthase